MEVRRLNPEEGFIREFNEYRNRVKSLETKPAGNITIRESLTTTDPNTGVSTMIGMLPDGSYGFEQFIGDTEPPPVATAPIVSAQPGVFIVSWNGSFVGSAAQPKDFVHLNILAQKIVSGNPSGSPIEVGVIRLQLDSVFVSTDICTVGETWRFYFTSEDYNGNISAPSLNSATVTFQSAATDAGINAALEGIRSDIVIASSKAVSAQNAAASAQNTADSAADKANAAIASGSSLIINGDFESLNNLGWGTFSAGVSIQNSTSTARSGSKVLAGVLGASSRSAYTDFVSGATGRTYYVEYWVRLRETLVAGTESFKLGALFSTSSPSGINSAVATYGTNYGGIEISLGQLSTTTWTKFATSYTITDADVLKVRFGPRYPGVTTLGNTLEIDDFRVIDVTEAALAQTKADQAFNSALSAASAAGSAQTSANSKNRVWYTGTAPAGIGHLTGDTWYDTANGNRINVWTGPTGTPPNSWVNVQDTAIKAAQQAATGAQASADGKVTNYYQPNKPVGTFRAGDQWFDTDDGYKLYVYVTTPAVNGISNDFAPFQDGAINELKNNVNAVTVTATGALSVANGKNKSYVGSSAPATSGSVVGDIWIDTSNGNMIRRYAGGGVWTDYRDTTISAANNAATAAASIANGKNSSYVGSTAPATSASTVGDLWIDTGNGNAIKRYAGSGNWVDYRDTTIASASNAATAAQASADGKTTTFYSPTQPSTVNRKTGDTWFDTDDDNKIYVWNGTWSATELGNSALANFAVTNAKIANGTIQYAKIGSVDAGSMTLGTLAAERIGANSIGVEKLTVGSMDNLISEPTFLNSGNAWVTGGAYTIDPTGARNGGPAFKIANAASQQGRYNNPWIPIEGGQSYRMMVWVKSDVSIPVSAISLFIRTRNEAGTVSPLRGGTNLQVIPANTWTPLSGTRKLPDNAVEVGFGIYKESSLSTGSTWFDFVSATRMAGGELIVDGAITAGSAIIADAAISSAQILSLNAAKVSASWLEAGEIKANSIKTPMLAVSDLTNFAPSYAEDATSWELDGGMIAITSTSAYDRIRFRSMVTSGTQRAMGPLMAVQEGDQLYAEGLIYRVSGNTASMYLRYYFFDSTKTYIISGGAIYDGPLKGTNSTVAAAGQMSSGSLHKITATVPANAMYARVVATIINTQGTDTGFYNLRGYRRFGGTLLVDGAIAANSGIIGNLAVDTAQIADGAITSLKVTEMNADKIKSGFLDTNRLLAGSIGADKIVVGIGYNLAYNGSAQQTGAAVGGTSDPTAPTAGYSGWIRATSTPPTGYSSYWTSTAGQGTTNFLNAPAVPVKPNTNYRVNVWVKADIAGSRTYLEPLTGSTAAGHRIMNPYPDANGVYQQMTYAFSNIVVPTEWTPWTVEFRTGTAPAQTMYFRWFVNHTNGTTTSSVFSFTGFELIEMTAGELLVNGAIKTQHMTAGTIDGGVITAATIKALQIGSKEISVDKLLVTSTDNMVQEADFTGLGRGWRLATDATPYAGWSINATAGRNSAPAMQLANAASAQETWNSTITGFNTAGAPIKTRLETSAAGKQTYRLSAWVKSTVSIPVSGVRLLTKYVTSGNVTTYGSVVYVTPGTKTAATIPANTWTEISGQVTTPDDNVNIAFGIQSAANLSTGTLYIDFVSATRASDGQLIVDGAITTNHMTAGTIDGAIITANTLNGSAIVGKSIQADRLVISSTDNLVLEADFTNNGSSWGTLNANKLISSTAGRGGGPALRVTGSTALQTINNLVNKVPVGTEDRFRGSFYVKSSAAATAGRYKLRIRPWTSTSTTGTPLDVAVSPALSSGVWTLVEGYSPALPANTIAVEFFLEATNAATGTTTDFDYVAVTRAADGKLVVDGAIDGKTITGATFQTSTTVASSGGIIYDSAGFRAYNPAGQQTFGITASNGNVTSTGTFATTAVSTTSGGVTTTARAVVGILADTQFDSVPGMTFERTTNGVSDAPAAIYYAGEAINLQTAVPNTTWQANTNDNNVSIGRYATTITAHQTGATVSTWTPIASQQTWAFGGQTGTGMYLNTFPTQSSENSRTASIKLYNDSTYDPMGAIELMYTRSISSTARIQSRMYLRDAGQWYIEGMRDNNGNSGTRIGSSITHDLNLWANGNLNLEGATAVLRGSNTANVTVGATTIDLTGTVTSNGAATFNNNFVVTNSGVTTMPTNTTIGGAAANWTGITATTVPYSAGYQGYAGFATPQYWRDPLRVSLTGVIGTTAASITLAAGNTYTVGVLPSGYRPSADLLFSPLVGATMSSNIVFYVRANGNLQYYSPTTQTLAQSAFYLGLDGINWLRVS